MGWDKDKYDVELMNILCVALGAKIGLTFKSEKARNDAIKVACSVIKAHCDKI